MNIYYIIILLYLYFILYQYNYVYYIVYSLADSVNTADSLDPARCAASQLSNTMLSSKTRKFQKNPESINSAVFSCPLPLAYSVRRSHLA